MKWKTIGVCLAVWGAAFTLPLSPQTGPMAEKAVPYVVDLDGNWDFTYDPNPPSQAFQGQGYRAAPVAKDQIAANPGYRTAPVDKDQIQVNNVGLPEPDQMPVMPADKDFVAQMPVPGIWDDHLDRLREASFWSKARFNPDFRLLEFPMGDDPPDASLPYLLGVGWYRRTFDAPQEWKSRLVTLRVGGVRTEAWVWLNGSLIAHHLGHSTPFEVPVNRWLHPGTQNTLLVAVANTRRDRTGVALWGWHGRSGGIYRPVSLKITGSTRITSCYLHSTQEGGKVSWTVDLEGGNLGQDAVLRWRIRDPENGRVLGEGTTAAGGARVSWGTETFGMRPWSDHAPNLYEVQVSLEKANRLLDRNTQSFGLRVLAREGNSLRLNGRPIMLRGGTDHYYFPLTTTAPLDVESYRDRIRKMEQIGFNWIRCHTWVPSEEYMQAADELGMMIQVERPTGSGEQEWMDILQTCRKHPSVVIYDGGNEELLDEERIDFLRRLAALQREYVPDALFNPQEGMRGVEYVWGKSELGKDQLGPDAVARPFPYNPRRLAQLREFSDVFGAYAWGLLSYESVQGDWRTLDERQVVYERPLLAHELGIHGNYLNLDLEHRFEGTRIGTDLYASVRRNLEKAGLLSKAAQYYQNSCAWMKILRKQAVETARKTQYIAGYDFLGSYDQNWLISGFPGGILNEFFELKPGESAADVLKYNGESVLLLDTTNHRNFVAGDRFRVDLFASLFGEGPLAEGTLRWWFKDDQGTIRGSGEWPLRGVPNGMIKKLGTIDTTLPELAEPVKLTLFTELSGGGYNVSNDWNYWVFPKARPVKTDGAADAAVLARLGSRYPDLRPIKEGNQSGLRIVSALDQDTLSFLNGGGRVLLLGRGPFPALPTSFQMALTGRVQGNLATVIADHPLMRRFPHESYCDWQFYAMLQGGTAVNFDNFGVPFDPIIDVVSSFKLIRKQSNLFEWKVGEGRLLVATLNLDLSDPAAAYLLDSIVAYVQGGKFQPRTGVDIKTIARLMGGEPHQP